MSAHVLPPLAVKSKSERKVNLLPPLGFEPVTFGMLTHLSDNSAKSHPITILICYISNLLIYCFDLFHTFTLLHDRGVIYEQSRCRVCTYVCVRHGVFLLSLRRLVSDPNKQLILCVKDEHILKVERRRKNVKNSSGPN
jgi:hypothetical protein